MNLQRAVWKIFSIGKKEYRFVIPLYILYFFSGSFYTIGQIYSETLFINTYGAKGFSNFFIQNGFVLIFTGILYNYLMLKINLRKGYIILITSFSSFILLSSLFIGEYYWLSFYIYMGNYLATFFLDIHFFNYTYQFLTLRNSKRILPFLIGGGKLGGIIMSLSIFMGYSDLVAQYGYILWAINGFFLLIPLIILSTKKEMRYKKVPTKHRALLPDLNLAKRLARKFKLSYSSPIFIFSVSAIFFMAIVNQISEYYFAGAFNARFPTRGELAAFLSIYTFAADFITLIIITLLTSRIINFFGVKKSNVIYPFSFVFLIILFPIVPGIVAGILLRFYRKNLGPIIRTPIFNIIMAASPRDRMAEVKSFISAIISPLGMVIGGISIYIIHNHLSIYGGLIFTLVLGICYVTLTFFQNRSYVNSLKNNLTMGNINRYQKGFELRDLEAFLSDNLEIQQNQKIVESIFNENPSVEALDSLYKNFEKLTEETKENILNLLKFTRSTHERLIIASSLKDGSPTIRACAYSLLISRPASYRKDLLLKNLYENRESSEDIAIEYLLRADARLKGAFEDSYIEEKIVIIKDEIIRGVRDITEFIILINALPHRLIKDHLIDLAATLRNPVLIKFCLPFINKIDKEKIRIFLQIVSNGEINLLTSFFASYRSISSMDKIFVLNNRYDLTEFDMERMFRYDTDEIVLKHIYSELTNKKSYYQKYNYLNYLIAVNNKKTAEIFRFIDHQIETVWKCSRLIDTLKLTEKKLAPGILILSNFMILSLKDSINLHKNLILKGFAVYSGTHIDEIYEMNVIAKDKDMYNYLLEFIETTGKDSKKAIEIFQDKERTEEEPVHLPGITIYGSLKESINYMAEFQPAIYRMSNLKAFYEVFKSDEILSEETVITCLKENKEMLDLLEKIICLQDSELFSNLQLDELVQIAKIANEFEIDADTILFSEGDRGDELFIIIDGEVEIYTESGFSTKSGQGECIGELSVIDEDPRSTSVRAIGSCRILSIKRYDMLHTLMNHPNISVNIMKIITGRLRSHLHLKIENEQV